MYGRFFKQDFERMRKGISGGRFALVRAWSIPGVKAVACYRFGQWINSQPLIIRFISTPFYRVFRIRVLTRWGIDIPREARIGPGPCVGHFGGIFISKHAVIGKNFNLSQDVTIGMSGRAENRGVPVIGDNVYVAPGAKIFGQIVIGDNVKIGANAVVYKDIPDNAVVVMKPGFEIVSMQSGREEEIKQRESL